MVEHVDSQQVREMNKGDATKTREAIELGLRQRETSLFLVDVLSLTFLFFFSSQPFLFFFSLLNTSSLHSTSLVFSLRTHSASHSRARTLSLILTLPVLLSLLILISPQPPPPTSFCQTIRERCRRTSFRPRLLSLVTNAPQTLVSHSALTN